MLLEIKTTYIRFEAPERIFDKVCLDKDEDELAESEFGAIGVRAANEYKTGTNTEGFVIQGKYKIYSNVHAILAWRRTKAEASVYDDESSNFFQLDFVFEF